jgi:hypothetical protein
MRRFLSIAAEAITVLLGLVALYQLLIAHL